MNVRFVEGMVEMFFGVAVEVDDERLSSFLLVSYSGHGGS